MSILTDKFGIINNIPIEGKININETVSVFIQNLLNNNIIYHPLLLNNILSNNEYDKNKLLKIIERVMDTHNRARRLHFKQLVKKNEFTHIDINNYIYEYINITRKINSYLHKSSLSINKYDKDYKLGSSLIIKHCITSFIDIIISDQIINNLIENAIATNSNLYKFFKNISDISVYSPDNDIYLSIVKQLENTIIVNILEHQIDNLENKTFNHIYNFKLVIDNYIDFKKRFKYINIYKKDFLNNIINYIKSELKIIVTHLNISAFIDFIKTYKYYFENLETTDIYPYLTIALVFMKIQDNEIYYNNEKIEFNQIGKLLEIFIDISKNDGILQAIFSQFNKEFFENDFIITKLVETINYNIIHNKCCKSYIIMSGYIKNKDIFYTLMKQKLIERIVYQNCDIKKETNILEYLKINHNILKYETIIRDVLISSFDGISSNIYIMTENMWDININNGYAIFNDNTNFKGEFSNKCFDIEKVYRSDKDIHQLLYHLDIGYVNITIKNLTGRVNVRMLPIQLICFELFANNKIYTKNELMGELKTKLVNYKDDFIEKVILSLVDSNLIIINSNKYIENKKFSNNDFNFINIFNKINNTNAKLKHKIFEEISFTRNNIINTNINSFLKLEKLSKHDLFEKCKTHISLFKLDMEMFNKSIKCMINKDYIKLNDDKTYSKLLY
jgi:hypothetical protein